MTLTIPEIIERLSNSELLKTIRSPDELISALKDLDALIEMTEAKEAIALQLEYIILKLSRGPVESVFDDQMLHTVISGPPGVGKTQLGKILARIWHSLGLLKGSPNKSKRQRELELKLEATHEKYGKVLERTNDRLLEASVKCDRITGDLVKENESIRNVEIYGSLIELTRLGQEILDIRHDNKMSAPSFEKEEKVVPFKVVSRVDFVAEYLGQTAVKTKKLLEESLGGVVFIDEAYSLVNDGKDSFGSEALTTLNLFMSEHPNEIVIIFAGYENMLEKTIFRAQPGLKRRCNWFFHIEGYSGEGLAKIFVLQLKQWGWKVHKSVDLVAFFNQNSRYFTNFGGDTAKFAFYCKLYQMDQEFVEVTTVQASNNENRRGVKRKVSSVASQCITEGTLEIALAKYRSNRSEKEPETTSHLMMYS